MKLFTSTIKEIITQNIQISGKQYDFQKNCLKADATFTENSNTFDRVF